MSRIVWLAIATVVIGIASPICVVAQTAKDFVGTWMLVSAITERDGDKSDTFGPNAKGVLMFDANGHYMITFIGASLPKFASNNRATGTADENKAVVGGSLSISVPILSTRRTRASHIASTAPPFRIGITPSKSVLSPSQETN